LAAAGITDKLWSVEDIVALIGDAMFQKFKIYKGFGPEFQTEALPTRKSRTWRSMFLARCLGRRARCAQN
jgi:hypothetical protein